VLSRCVVGGEEAAGESEGERESGAGDGGGHGRDRWVYEKS
jgi:hypothetical protein